MKLKRFLEIFETPTGTDFAKVSIHKD